MQLNKFDGGLNIRVDPSLILANEAVLYKNIDNEKLVLKSVKDVTVTATSVTGYFYNFKGTWLSSTAERSYVEYKDFVYFTETNKRARKYNGASESNLGINSPVTPPIATQANPVATEKISASLVVLTYCYTYYNTEFGIESAPSALSNELSLAANKVVDLTGLTASADPQVDKIRIYRIGDSITVMELVIEVANAVATIRDDIPTLNLPGTILDTYNNQVPLTGLQYLTEAYGIMFAAFGDKLYYSEIGKPDYWPAANFIDFSHDITGILPVPNGILVFSTYKTDILVGTSNTDFAVLPVSTEQGSISHLSGKTIKSSPIWVSADGICNYSSGVIEVISLDKLGNITLSVVNAIVNKGNYYLCLSDGTLLVMDTRFGLIFKTFAFSSFISNIASYNNDLYARVNTSLATVFTGNDLAFAYTSPVFTEGAHANTKLYDNIYIRSNGTFSLELIIDNTIVLTKTLTGNKIHDITPPQEEQRGTEMQFAISGIGTIYAIDYGALGRQNGR